MDLTVSETRVLGCLLEKQRTTPDLYPLTLNGLRSACNQSTNRDPVVKYDDAVIREALHRLERRGFARLASGRGSRAPKYRHLLAEALPMAADEQALVCVLMLRGAQTPGELKQRAERMHPFASLDGVHDALARLIERGLVARLERQPGQKEERFLQLLQAGEEAAAPAPSASRPLEEPQSPREVSQPDGSQPGRSPQPAYGSPADGSPAASSSSAPDAADGTVALEERIARLEREVAELRALLAP
jgi:uncharacterized protein YceH (UPF0502 family)